MKTTYFDIVESPEGKRIDLFGENWYKKGTELIPSVTFIQSATHVNKSLAKYMQEFGEAGSKSYYHKGIIGTEMHQLIDIYLKSGSMDFGLISLDNPDDKLEVWKRFCNFVNFDEKVLAGHEIIGTEMSVFNEIVGYAGTLDLLTCKDGKYHVWDWKSSANVFKEHKSQISAYCMALEQEIEEAHVVLIHEENTKIKQGYSHTILNKEQIDEYFELFIWYKKAFDREIKTPLIKSLPINFERI